MKKTLSLVTLSFLFSVVSCKENANLKITDEDMKVVEAEKAMVGKLPKVEFDKADHDFGTIKSGDKVSTEFIVKNIGESDLIISNAEATCGCTVPDYPKQPLKPGETAPIKVTFDSSGKSGQQSKTVTLTTNTESGKETFTIKANVLGKEASPIVNK
ncbi:hypothetical protein SY27_06705 [Flavobacterium sp. 316]|nr:hypothetical protein SY27_06705 [Flavobacterium sp. 316]